MSPVDYSELAARVLKRRPVATRETGLSRDRGIGIIAEAMKESALARRRRRWWAGGVVTTAVAAAALLAMPRNLRPSHGPSTAHGAAACSNSPAACAATSVSALAGIDIGHMNGREIVPGGVMQADLDHPARVDFDSGTRLLLGGNTMLAYDEGSAVHRFSLSRGSVHMEVVKIAKGQRFLLNTLDAEVEVRGTVLNVAVIGASNGCEQRTRVSVQEGIVEVRTATELRTLRAGETWSGECPAVSKLPAAPGLASAAGAMSVSLKSEPTIDRRASKGNSESESMTNAPSASAGSQAASLKSLTAEVQPASELAKQNDIYERASAERNQGHVAEALALYRQLITRYPGSALVESACVERIRLLRKFDRPLALDEARRYLLQFPKGFAQAEAEALVNVP